MPPTDKPVELSEVERLLTALGQNASGWAGPVRLLWRYAKALVAEVAALRTENENLRERVAAADRYEEIAEQQFSAHADIDGDLTAEIAAMHERLRTARAELAAERAQHETTRAEKFVRTANEMATASTMSHQFALDGLLRTAGLLDAEAKVRAVKAFCDELESKGVGSETLIAARVRAALAASPSPVAGQDQPITESKEPI